MVNVFPSGSLSFAMTGMETAIPLRVVAVSGLAMGAAAKTVDEAALRLAARSGIKDARMSMFIVGPLYPGASGFWMSGRVRPTFTT
jgi:hypothetical protein